MSRRRSVCATAVATVAVTALTAVPSTAAPEPGGVAALLTQLKSLYQQAEAADEAYDTTEQALVKQRARTARAGGGLAAARAELERGRNAAGALARAQYRGTPELSGYLRLLLSDHPEQAVEQQHMLARIARGTLAAEGRLAVGKQRADAAAAASGAALAKQQQLAALKRKQRDTAEAKLQQVESLLAGLTPDQLTRLSALDRSATDRAQQGLLDSGALGPQVRAAVRTAMPAAATPMVATPTAAGATAVRFAVRQIGRPYDWGSAGPYAYDCSGLTSRAWAHAGVTVPRTSGAQWRTLPHVPLDRLRPGDLVVYFPKATHVAMYLGDGKVVHVPRPGAHVKVSPIAAHRLLGAVRPDAAGTPLSPAAYRRPVLPPGAEAGSDTVSDVPTRGK